MGSCLGRKGGGGAYNWFLKKVKYADNGIHSCRYTHVKVVEHSFLRMFKCCAKVDDACHIHVYVNGKVAARGSG